MKIVDRILTIVITATLTSAVWIVVGGSLIENANSSSQIKVTRPATAGYSGCGIDCYRTAKPIADPSAEHPPERS